MVTVKLFGTLSLDLGQSSLELDLTGSTLAEVIDEMADQHGSKVREELLDEDGNLDFAYGIFCDGEKINYLDSPIQNGTELVIVNMMGGG